MTAYIWPAGIAVQVTCTAVGEPLAFIWKGHTHPVEFLIRQWRVDLEWWQERQWRAYFRLSTGTGLLVILYQDLMTGEWFLQSLYD